MLWCIDPRFVRSFPMLYEFEKVQKFKVMVFDADENKAVEQLKLEQQVHLLLFVDHPYPWKPLHCRISWDMQNSV